MIVLGIKKYCCKADAITCHKKHIQYTYSIWITTNKISGSKTTLRFAQCTRRQQKKRRVPKKYG